MSTEKHLQFHAELARLTDVERAMKAAALKSLREYRRARYATRQLPCQPKAA